MALMGASGFSLDSMFVPQPTSGNVKCRNSHGAQHKRHIILCCQRWFDFNADLSEGQKNPLNSGDFKVLSHLKQLGCGDLISKPKPIHFRGCMNESFTFNCVGGNFFVKINRSLAAKDMFFGEHEALLRLNISQGVRVPKPLGYGDLPDGGSYIILEHLQFRPFGMMRNKSQADLGRSLAMLHQCDVGDLFGFPLSTRLGSIPLENAWMSSWEEFFVEMRLKDRLMRVYQVLGDNAKELRAKESMLIERARDILGEHRCKPSILHGDLWLGNTGLLVTGEVAMFDPATFIGDPEFDLAFQGWSPIPGFPGFSDAFYDAYHEILPRTSSFSDRHKIYQLFHLLNHLLIYGLEYYNHVKAMVDSLV